MADSDTTTETKPAMSKVMVPITKAKANIEVDYALLPDEIYQEVILQGLKQVLNRGQSKLTKASTKDEAELKALVLAKAEEFLKAAYEGDTKKIKLTGAPKSVKVTGAVMTEARRLAKNLVKDEIKRSGGRISHYASSEITKAANALIADDPTIIETAKANLEERESKPVKINVAAIPTSDAKVKAAAAKRAKDKSGTLSAKQAGMVQPKAKGKAPQPTAH